MRKVYDDVIKGRIVNLKEFREERGVSLELKLEFKVRVVLVYFYIVVF